MQLQNQERKRKARMDNIFDVLIYLIIIISFISSFFKKKNKELIKRKLIESQAQAQQKISDEPNVKAAIPVKTQYQEYDIF